VGEQKGRMCLKKCQQSIKRGQSNYLWDGGERGEWVLFFHFLLLFYCLLLLLLLKDGSGGWVFFSFCYFFIMCKLFVYFV
jgi:hypothetical protein